MKLDLLVEGADSPRPGTLVSYWTLPMSEASAFELAISVSPSDIDQLGHVNNVRYVQWVQDAAVAHWKTVAPPDTQQKLLW